MPTITWEDPAAALYRGCQLCDHRAERPTGLCCVHPSADRGGMFVHVARSMSGHCGPDAKHLTFPGLHAPLAPIRFTGEAA